MEQSRRHWGVPRFDLMQVHNLLSWPAHLETLFAMKAGGKLRYVGITTSEGRRRNDIERILETQAIDTVQLTYNVLDREVEARILPLARERGIAVIVNRPFRQGDLTGSSHDIRFLHGPARRARQLGAVPAEVHRVASGRHLRHSGHVEYRPCPRKHGSGAGILPDEALRRRMATMSGSSDVGMVDLHALRFPDVLAAGLLSAFRAAQSCALAGSSC